MAMARQREAPSPSNTLTREHALTTSPAVGSPPRSHSPQQGSRPLTPTARGDLPVSNPENSFPSTSTAPQAGSGGQAGQVEGSGSLGSSLKSRSSSFAESKFNSWRIAEGSINSYIELRLDRFFARAKRKAKRNGDHRDRAGRPPVLDKEDTSKLTKFWNSVTGNDSEAASLKSPPPPTHLTRLPFGVPEVTPEVSFDRKTFDSLISADPFAQPAYFRRKAAMDASRLTPEPRAMDGEKKQKAIQDAKDMSQRVRRTCERTNTDIPPYDFIELIGKGSFGRVYKCKECSTGELVAIKIINTDDVDYGQRAVDKDDTIRDFRKEVTVLQQLKDKNAKNVNLIHEAFDLQDQLWIVSEYCTGGSIRTLMRAQPASHPGLDEQYIIPVARELALAIKSVHDIGVIHRDIKCTNVYVTEEGDIQLGDFGIVGVLDDEGAKRRTVIGTPHFMSLEMLDDVAGTNQSKVAYGSEVDIWSLGCAVYEMATGLPPNAYQQSTEDIKAELRTKAPRLEDGNHSQELRDFVASCLNSDPKERPTADAILKHPYVAGTQKKYPTKALVSLIRKYKAWEYGGGWRQSLFQPGGAPPVAGDQAAQSEGQDFDDWNFSTSDSFNEDFAKRYSQMEADRDAQGLRLDTSAGGGLPSIVTEGLTPWERAQQAHKELSASRGERSLDRLWDPTSAPYELHTPVEDPEHLSDLPLRKFTGGPSSRESHVVIDLDSAARASMNYDDPAFNFDFGDVPTLKAARGSKMPSQDDEDDEEYNCAQTEEDREKRATMDWKFPTTKRATMDWTFPRAEPKGPDDPDMQMNLPSAGDGGDLPHGFRPTLEHTTTEPIGQFRDNIHPVRQLAPPSASPIRESVIDLDLGGFDDPVDLPPRPGTASSATGSVMTDMTSGNPFDLEEDPEQNEIDRNRFSYHKQYRSEGGQMKRGSHRNIPMHSGGNSLSSTDADLDHSSASDDDVFEYNRKLSESMGHQLNATLPHDHIDLDTWPQFDRDSGFDEVRSYTDELDDLVRQNGPVHPSALGMPGQDEIEFPRITAPHPDALVEDADPQLVVSELDRLLDDFEDALTVTTRALQQHTGVNGDDEDESEEEY